MISFFYTTVYIYTISDVISALFKFVYLHARDKLLLASQNVDVTSCKGLFIKKPDELQQLILKFQKEPTNTH